MGWSEQPGFYDLEEGFEKIAVQGVAAQKFHRQVGRAGKWA
jgi:hypothetical protein